jgi:LmbE family N-acetylglucosaminyl deacetylase
MPPSLSRRRRAKLLLRRIAIAICGGLLRTGSRPYVMGERATIVIAPHQDDETLACGGLIARKRNEGLPVHVIFITDGSASHPGHPRLSPADIARLRREEAMRAMACLGVERPAVHFLGEPDGTLNVIAPARRAALVGRLAALLTEIQPGRILVPCHPDGSSEHDAAFEFVLEAIARARASVEVWQYPVWTWWNPGLLLRRWLSSRDCRRQPLEDQRQAKEEAIGCYLSQIAPLPPDTSPALPPDFVEIFRQDTEFFFRYDPNAPKS